MERTRVIVSGRVQGVGFRWSTRAVATTLGLTGFARNQADGTVLVEAQGAPESLASLSEWLTHGPATASVSGVDASSIPPVAGESGFAAG